MTRNKVQPKKIGDKCEALAELNEFILNHMRYDDNFILIRMVVTQQTPLNTETIIKPSSNIEFYKKIAETFRKSIRSEDYVGKLGIDEYLIIVKDSNPANGALVANRLSRIVSDATDGKYIGRSYVTEYREGDNASTLLERIMH
jgi:hypothetical protein